MLTLYLTLLVLINLIGFACVFFTSFGTFIIFIGAVLYALVTHFEQMTFLVLAVIFFIYAIGEIIEYLFVVLGVKKMGASKYSAIGAVIGGMLGALLGVPLLGVGIIAGTFAGIFIGAFLLELMIKRDFIASLKAGVGGLIGRVGSVGVKIMLAFLIFVIEGFVLLGIKLF